ncbi:hypothetical protein DFP83_1422 [Idiomarina fontislapidosi]|nr:hypothetical protein DFP83_1422 [Idiomarina fontislapidosi]
MILGPLQRTAEKCLSYRWRFKGPDLVRQVNSQGNLPTE